MSDNTKNGDDLTPEEWRMISEDVLPEYEHELRSKLRAPHLFPIKDPKWRTTHLLIHNRRRADAGYEPLADLDQLLVKKRGRPKKPKSLDATKSPKPLGRPRKEPCVNATARIPVSLLATIDMLRGDESLGRFATRAVSEYVARRSPDSIDPA